MNNIFFLLAYLNCNQEKNKKDIIDAYILIVCSVINEKGYFVLSIEKLQADLIESFDIKIPLEVLDIILMRMSDESLVTKIGATYVSNHGKIVERIKISMSDQSILQYDIFGDLHVSARNAAGIEKFNLDAVDYNLRKFSKDLSRGIFNLITLVLIALILLFKCYVWEGKHNLRYYLYLLIACMPNLFGPLRWAEFIPGRQKIESSIEEWIYNKLKKALMKEQRNRL